MLFCSVSHSKSYSLLKGVRKCLLTSELILKNDEWLEKWILIWLWVSSECFSVLYQTRFLMHSLFPKDCIVIYLNFSASEVFYDVYSIFGERLSVVHRVRQWMQSSRGFHFAVGLGNTLYCSALFRWVSWHIWLVFQVHCQLSPTIGHRFIRRIVTEFWNSGAKQKVSDNRNDEPFIKWFEKTCGA